MTSNCKSESAPLRVRLEQLEREGIKLFLNGVPSTTDYIVKTCINEETVYMPDYVTDEQETPDGTLITLRPVDSQEKEETFTAAFPGAE